MGTKLIAAGTGYNQLFVTLGVFESRAGAEKALSEAGCVRNEKGQFFTTQAFADYMVAKKLPCYSTGIGCSEGWPIEFREIPVNEIAIGYDDD